MTSTTLYLNSGHFWSCPQWLCPKGEETVGNKSMTVPGAPVGSVWMETREGVMVTSGWGWDENGWSPKWRELVPGPPQPNPDRRRMGGRHHSKWTGETEMRANSCSSRGHVSWLCSMAITAQGHGCPQWKWMHRGPTHTVTGSQLSAVVTWQLRGSRRRAHMASPGDPHEQPEGWGRRPSAVLTKGRAKLCGVTLLVPQGGVAKETG